MPSSLGLREVLLVLAGLLGAAAPSRGEPGPEAPVHGQSPTPWLCFDCVLPATFPVLCFTRPLPCTSHWASFAYQLGCSETVWFSRNRGWLDLLACSVDLPL